MKKTMVVLLICCLVLAISGSIFANEGEITGDRLTANVRDTVQLSAYVTPYASVKFNTPQALTFSGVPNETKEGAVTYTLETNCDVNADGYGTAFQGNTHGDFLQTWYECDPGDVYNDALIWREAPQTAGATIWAPDGFDAKYVKDATQDFTIRYKATTGPNISSQWAGNYSATYTITIWSPQNLN